MKVRILLVLAWALILLGAYLIFSHYSSGGGKTTVLVGVGPVVIGLAVMVIAGVIEVRNKKQS